MDLDELLEKETARICQEAALAVSRETRVTEFIVNLIKAEYEIFSKWYDFDKDLFDAYHKAKREIKHFHDDFTGIGVRTFHPKGEPESIYSELGWAEFVPTEKKPRTYYLNLTPKGKAVINGYRKACGMLEIVF